MRLGSDIRVLLVDDHRIVLHGLTEYLAGVEGIEVVGTALSGKEALRIVKDAEPRVALLDVRLPDMDGIELCREIRTRCPQVMCLMFSSYPNEQAMFEAILAGASGYILKEARLEEVVAGIRAVAAGKSLLDPQMTQRLLERIRNPALMAPSLSPQESKMVDLIAQGLTNREIGDLLSLAEQTVKNYVSAILAKLGLQRRSQVAAYLSETRDRRKTD